MKERQLTVLVWCVAVVWATLVLLGGQTLQRDFFQPTSKAAAVVVLLVLAFDRWLWRWAIFRGWLVERPNLQGTWRTVIRSNWVDPSTGQGIKPIDAYLVIRQTFSRLSIRLLTNESSSTLHGAAVTADQDGLFEVVGAYVNDPVFGVRDRSKRHWGGLVLSVHGKPGRTLRGHYWTDRETVGEIEAHWATRKVFDAFDAASQLDAEPKVARIGQ